MILLYTKIDVKLCVGRSTVFFYFTIRKNHTHITRSLDCINIIVSGLNPEIDYACRHETNIARIGKGEHQTKIIIII